MVVVYFNTFENTYYIFVLSDKHSGSCQIHCCVHDDPKKTLLYLQQY